MSQPSAELIGQALRQLRQAAKKLQDEAAHALGVSRVAISNYERGMLPEDFLEEKLPKLAELYGVSPGAVLARAEAGTHGLSSFTIPAGEPLLRHSDKLPVAVQVWFHAFMSDLLTLSLREDINAAAVERAREQITFAQLDLWAGGDLLAADSRRMLAALRWCAEAAWRSITEPGWLRRPKAEWGPLPAVFRSETGQEGAQRATRARQAGSRG
jgi:transcriptional regulator with XRE-family HTH domain